jgi:hypothetical protein
MPEMPAVQEELEVTIPAMNVPTREGEERFQAGLNLEDSRRKESVIEELRAQLKRLEGTSVNEVRTKFASSPSARRRQISARKKLEQLRALTTRRGDRWEGPCAPATVINLNPVPLRLEGELQRWMIPPAGRGLQVDIAFRGRKFVGSYMTISTPHLYGSHSGTQNDRQSGVDMPLMEYNHIPPIGLAHQFYDHFVEGAADAQYMGGVLIFEGDIHTLDPDRMERNDGYVWVPKKEITLDGFGDVVYIVEPQKFSACVEQSVMTQRNYTDTQIAEGHGFHNSKSEIIQNQLSNYHRTWHNYALEKGYIEAALPWAVERMKDSPRTQMVLCPDCRTRQADPDQHFCANCNAPFDALKSFLAGKTVSPDRLTEYEGDEWKAIVKETKRRKAKIAMLEIPAPKRGKAAEAETDEATED